MVQTGDPTNTGKGGESMYGKKFADEFRPTLRVRRSGLQLADCPFTAQRKRHRFDGKQWARYERIAVFHHLCQAILAGRQVHRFWKGIFFILFHFHS